MKLKPTVIFLCIIGVTMIYSQAIKVNDIRLSPRLLNYQGYLTDTQGNPLNDTFDFIFRIYDAASAGSQLWTETQIEVPILKGIFNVLLGSVSTIPDSIFTKGANRWLELRFNSQTLSPRTRIVSAPYAYTATYSDTALYAKAAAADNDWTISGNNQYSAVSGNVGIGTTSPTEKFELIGDIRVLGSATSGDTAIELQVAASTSGKGGKVFIKAGDGQNNLSANHWGGDVEIRAGAGENNSGGSIDIRGGMSSVWTQATDPTMVEIFGGGNDYSYYNCSGIITVEGSKQLGSGSANQSGGNITLMPGAAEGSGVPGYVGINTAIPTAMLDVFGSVRIADGTQAAGKVFTSDASGVGSWQAPAGSTNYWTYRITDTADTTLQMGGRWGLARAGNMLWGNADSTHVNFGVACTTGVTGMNNKYAAVSGGLFNVAGGVAANVGGGVNNRATGDAAVVNGGQANTASGYLSGIVAGSNNVASGDRAFVGGGISNAAGGNSSAIAGGSLNTTSGQWGVVGGGQSNSAGVLLSTVAGGQYDTVKAYFGGILSGYSNLAGDAPEDTGATVGGGYDNAAIGQYASVLGGRNNRAGGLLSTVGGGINNIADSAYATIAGGSFNTAGNIYASVGGGILNAASGTFATVDGGQSNAASGNNSVIGGGAGNSATGFDATVSGGEGNIAGGYSTVGGGWMNTALNVSTVAGGSRDSAVGGYSMVGSGYHNCAIADFSVIGGGSDNRATGTAGFIGSGADNVAGGYCSAIPGGYSNLANGSYSFAAGRRAKAYNQGCFVWGDATDADVFAGADNRWVARCSGGVYFYTNSGLTSGAYLAAGGGTWNSVSDRNLKENFLPVNGSDILDKIAQMEITTWNYKSQDASIRHIGPMAQDFAAFGVGDDDKHISTVDADGVALVAIQELTRVVRIQQARIEQLEAQQAEIEELRAQIAKLNEK